jgi:hypothetical protein
MLKLRINIINKNYNWNLRGGAVLASKDAGFETVETTYFDSALYVMGVKAAAFPSFAGGSTTDRSTTRDYETGNERAATSAAQLSFLPSMMSLIDWAADTFTSEARPLKLG